jgi:imidazolonepropionase-like amidohydrolase
MNINVYSSIVALTLALVSPYTIAQEDMSENRILIQNVKVFDGVSDSLTGTTNVLIEGNMITSVSADAADSGNATVIDGGGRVLMPGLADTHTHIAFGTNPVAQLMTGDKGYNYIHSAMDAEGMLMRGVTVIRDMGGDSFGLKKAIDAGITPGPRIYPSGGPLSQTAGHGDFRFPNQNHPRFGGHIQPVYEQGHGYMVDGVPEVLAAARDNLKKGASHIKVMAGGGYSSPSDPLLGNQFRFDEIKAAVDVASDWGTYVTVHAYHPSAINRAIDAGVKDIGHGQLLDEKTLRRMAKEGVILSTQPFTLCSEPHLDDFSNSKLAIVCKGTALVYETASKIKNLKVTYGTDLFFVPQEMMDTQVKQMERLLPWFEPVEILQMATGNASELFKMSGPDRNPYAEGDLGVVAVGAYADLLLVEGNPLEDLSAITDKDNLRIIMKDGKIYKNTLQ